ncbi:MAG: DUF488 domain-containing protein [Candidatus Saccharimonadales bacterium]
MATVQIKRIYNEPTASDGYRVLVDRLWPRGVSKEKAKLDEWLKEVGPSDGLRKWFNHDPAKFSQFKHKYKRELAQNPALAKLKQAASDHQTLTLIYSAKDELHNQAVVLREFLLN